MTTLSTGTRQRRNVSRSLPAHLSEADREVYRRIPEEVAFVPPPDFGKRKIEAELFGPEAEPIRVSRWRQYPDESHPDETRRAVPRLTRQQEATLFMRYNYARCRLAKLIPARRRRSDSRIQAILLWRRRAQENLAALASANMALVVAMANRAKIRNVEYGELVSEGNMALLRAIDKFDICRGFRFSTYACGAILRAFSGLASKTGTYRRRFPIQFVPEMERCDEAQRRYRDQRGVDIEELQYVLSANIAGLSEIERKVLGARFAVLGFQRTRTLREASRLIGLSKERIRQIQHKAIAKLGA
ncbi:hypothetical protein LCGC14_2837060, partial [marine sediment metagenome]